MTQTSGENPVDPAAAQVIHKARRLMLIASMTTLIALAAVLAVIGYRVSHGVGRASPPASDISALLPPGAKVISTAIGEGRLSVMIETNGAQEVRLFDLRTLQPAGRIQLVPKP